VWQFVGTSAIDSRGQNADLSCHTFRTKLGPFLNVWNRLLCDLYVHLLFDITQTISAVKRPVVFCSLFCMGAKLGLWYLGKNTDCGFLRTGCWGEYLDLRQIKWREVGEKLCIQELHNLCSYPSIIRMTKSKRIRWTGHVGRMGERRNECI
jgi:hypothetical protein